MGNDMTDLKTVCHLLQVGVSPIMGSNDWKICASFVPEAIFLEGPNGYYDQLFSREEVEDGSYKEKFSQRLLAAREEQK